VIEKEGAKTITVSKGNDSADFALVNMIQNGDIVITQDYGLAAMCLARGAVPVSQDGMIYTNDNIDALLLQRYLAKKLRMSGRRFKDPPKWKPEQNDEFEKVLKKYLEAYYEILPQRTPLPHQNPPRLHQHHAAD
jgi:uncharacterized protein YaiI (UPF0178 family)